MKSKRKRFICIPECKLSFRLKIPRTQLFITDMGSQTSFKTIQGKRNQRLYIYGGGLRRKIQIVSHALIQTHMETAFTISQHLTYSHRVGTSLKVNLIRALEKSGKNLKEVIQNLRRRKNHFGVYLKDDWINRFILTFY